MSKARSKGTSWESELLPLLRETFGPQVERAPLRGINDLGDFTGLPGDLILEAKKTDVPHYLQWAKICNKKAKRWAILWSGDRRRGDGPFVMLPLDHYLELAYANEMLGPVLSADEVTKRLAPYLTDKPHNTDEEIAELEAEVKANGWRTLSLEDFEKEYLTSGGSSVHTDASGFVIEPLHQEET